MKNLVYLFMATVMLSLVTIAGCGERQTTVIEAPPVTEEVDPAMEGMTEEEYDKAMEESMNQ